MRAFLIAILSFIAYNAGAQKKMGIQRDTRAVLLNESSYIKKFSVLPDGKISVVTDRGEVYYANGIDSNWHHLATLDASGIDDGSDYIHFFNQDTGIVYGSISTIPFGKKDGYYFTENGGKKWNLLSFGGDSWIQDGFCDNNGHIWWVCSGDEMFYSDDYGAKWRSFAIPYKHSGRYGAIYMADTVNGILASDKEILTTRNNWRTAINIPTPIDQGKYTGIPNSYGSGISNVSIWKGCFVTQQYMKLFYTDTTHIDWKAFPVNIGNFSIDKESRVLYGVTESNEAVLANSPTDLRVVGGSKLSGIPFYSTVVNKAMYVICRSGLGEDRIYRIDENGISGGGLYTTDVHIEMPEQIAEADKLTWGVTGPNLYLSEDRGKSWYRVDTLNAGMWNLNALSDSLIFFTDWKINKTFTYSLSDRKVRPYAIKEPYMSFLSYPIKNMIISAKSSGCEYHKDQILVYQNDRKDSLFSTHYSETRDPYSFNDSMIATPFINSISIKMVTEVLKVLNKTPFALPSINDMNITTEDKASYLLWCQKYLEKNDDNSYAKMDSSLLYSLPGCIDTFSSATVKEIFDIGQALFASTSSMLFTVRIINTNNDTLILSRKYSEYSPWHLPWKISYNRICFNSYSMAFSKYTQLCLPHEFIGYHEFDNTAFLIMAARYIHNKRRNKGH